MSTSVDARAPHERLQDRLADPQTVESLNRLLDHPEVMAEYHVTMKANIDSRLNRLYDGIADMKARGPPVDAIRPQGGI